MDKYKKYRKIRRRLETVSALISIFIGNGISSALGIYGKKIISLDSILNLAIICVIAYVLNFFAVKISDKWYEKNMDK
ncbi:hypothetical protein [Candidatus Clostridium radicumherbarum]|uniref:Uncharacterized protein n=1 Tax=Candidatus Clostridium radicumherbarum TaxID=3381662 RepID=A0ABW8TVH8_9CLOT